MRKFLKVLHSLASCGLIGGLACYMILLVYAPQESAETYADLRQAIAAISDYILLPSLAVALVSGLLSMAVHRPYQDKGWALLKAAFGILMFKGVLVVIGANAGYAASISRRLADGEPVAGLLAKAIEHEWATLWIVMALSVFNVVLGVWRPKLSRRARAEARRAPQRDSAEEAVAEEEESRAAA
ncbi:hypothetical protein [Afifella sp. IM 167]|uniref:hypothetical protein n=1 Tax=Afifella sp. IM 167 TaxID=2033586 RepID=UPI001CCD077C|nr:hypothetical protein [Afifella sp. IM 167]MBZ8131963.1 hypothetical protein [Afifella sp. IM 167]